MKRNLGRLCVSVVGVTAGLALLAPGLDATPIGIMQVVFDLPAAVDNNTVDFGYTGGSPNPTGSGTFTVGMGSTGSFAVAPFIGDTGTMKNLNRAIEPVANPIDIPDEITFGGGASNFSFTLTMVDAGVFSSANCLVAPAAGQTCTPSVPGGSPFNLVNNAGGTSTVSFVVDGLMVDSLNPGAESKGIGIYTAQFTTPYQSVLAMLGASGFVSTTDSATFTFSPVPEPATGLMMFAGAALLLVSKLRRRS